MGRLPTLAAQTEVDAKVRRASTYVAQHEEALTPIRATVLRLLYAEGKAIGAYELVFKFQKEVGRRIAPNTVYRALDFLVRYRLTAHVSSRRAFVGLNPPNANDADTAIFFLCVRCGRLFEQHDAGIDRAVRNAAMQIAFAVKNQNVEIAGTCANCIG